MTQFIESEAMESFGNSSANISCVPPSMHPALGIFIQTVYLAICLIGLLGNTLVIYVVLRFSKLQTVTNMYILNLAIADECFLIGIPFLVTTQIYASWPFGGTMCKIYMTTVGINQFTSSIFLTIMSADRYIAVCHPITSPKLRTPVISKIVAGTAWTISALMMVPIIMYSDSVQDGMNRNHSSCNIIWPSNTPNTTEQQKQVQFNTFTIYSFTLSFAIPLSLIFIFYVLVIRKLKTVGPKNKSKEKKKSHRKVTKLVLTVITVYVLCWLPYWIGQLVLVFQTVENTEGLNCGDSESGVSLFLLSHLITSILSNANSAMNPVLYAFLSDNFKKSFLKACTCAAGREVNATLHLENSVFPKKQTKGSERRAKATTLCPPGEEDNNEEAQLVSKGDHSTMTMTSRSNVTISSDVTVRENGKEDATKNGVRSNSQPTAV